MLDSHIIQENLHDRGEAVGSARSGGDHMVLGGVIQVIVNTIDNVQHAVLFY
jgi:hypothetical protein